MLIVLICKVLSNSQCKKQINNTPYYFCNRGLILIKYNQCENLSLYHDLTDFVVRNSNGKIIV